MSQDRSNSYSQVLDTLEHILDRPIAFQPIFARITGSINAGLFLSQAWYWQKIINRSEYEGWFYKTQAEWEEETLLTRREQETSRKILKRLGVLEERKSGSPAKLFFRIRIENLFSAAQTYAADHSQYTKPPSKYGVERQASMAVNANLDCTQTPISIRKQRLPETTTENTNTLFDDIAKPKPKNWKAARIPEDFAVTDLHRRWAKENNLTSPDSLIDQFRDYWTAKAGRDSTKLDWDATFRNWIRNAMNYHNNGKGNGNGKTDIAQAYRDTVHRMHEEDV